MNFTTRYIFGFALAICVVCSVAVAGAAVALKDLQDINRERDLHKSILEALGFDPAELQGETIDRLWEGQVELVIVTPAGEPVDQASCAQDADDDGDCDLDDTLIARESAAPGEIPALLPLYKRIDGDETLAWAVPVYGMGLWGPIAGYIALSPDVSEVVGTTFFAPKETPGLGAEIEQPPFEQQWEGKSIFEGDEPRAIQVAKGSAATSHPAEIQHWVDGVSGATITSRGVSEMVVEAVEQHYAETLVRLKTGGL